MKTTKIWRHIQRVQAELRRGTLESCDAAINDLQTYLIHHPAEHFPASCYPALIQIHRYYTRTVLPQRKLPTPLEQAIVGQFERCIHTLYTRESRVKELEAQFAHLLQQFQFRQIRSAKALISQFRAILNLTASGIPTDRTIERLFRSVQQSFTLQQVQSFFTHVFTKWLSDEEKGIFQGFASIFWNQVDDLFYPKVVLVDRLTGKALLTRLHLETAVDHTEAGDRYEFENVVDEQMRQSGNYAIRAARNFLQDQFPEYLDGKTLFVQCYFQHPTAEYADTSASLPIAAKIVGDVLGLPVQPHIVMTGAIDANGSLRPVQHVAAKIRAAQAYPGIEQIYLPMKCPLVEKSGLTVMYMTSFAEALEHYYGGYLGRKRQKRLFKRRTILKTIAGAFLMPPLAMILDNVLNQPVTEHDWQLLTCAGDLYQKQSDYHSAIVIYEALLDKLRRERSNAESLQVQAYALGSLGVIALQQNQKERSLAYFQRALAIWTSLHDAERQADMLLRIAELYRYTVALDGMRRNAQQGLRYYQQAIALLTPSMPHFQRLRGKCCAALGYMYYWLEEYDLAKTYCEQGVSFFDEPETNWSYQTSRQHLGRVLAKVREFDRAHELLESTAHAAVLQSPYYRARSLLSLSEFSFEIEDRDAGIEYASQAHALCRHYRLPSQHILVKRLSLQYHIETSRDTLTSPM